LGTLGLKRRRSIDPEKRSFAIRGIEPAVATGAFKPEAVSLVEDVTLEFVKPDFQAALEHVEKLFAGMRIRTIATGTWRHVEEHGLQHFCSGRKKLHGDSGFGAKHLALVGLYDGARLVRQIVEFEHGCIVSGGEALKSGDRRIGLRKFDGTQESGRDFGAAGGFGDVQIASLAEAAQFHPHVGGRTRRDASFCRETFIQDVLDTGNAQLFDVAEVFDALENFEQVRAVETETALAANWRDQTDVFPLAQRGWAYTQNSCRLTDSEKVQERSLAGLSGLVFGWGDAAFSHLVVSEGDSIARNRPWTQRVW
jgi:hypothetical protein